jgi:hypothetical protein
MGLGVLLFGTRLVIGYELPQYSLPILPSWLDYFSSNKITIISVNNSLFYLPDVYKIFFI